MVGLSAELCKGGPSLIVDFIKEFYSFDVVFSVIADEDIPSAYRAIFLHLFKESYLVNDFKYSMTKELPQLVRVRQRKEPEVSELKRMFMSFRQAISEKYFEEGAEQLQFQEEVHEQI